MGYTMIDLVCDVCGKGFERRLAEHEYRRAGRSDEEYKPVCSSECSNKRQVKAKEFACEQCGKSILKRPGELKGSNHVFCSKSCAATYSNAHRAYVAPADKECPCIGCGVMQTVNGHVNPALVRCSACTPVYERKRGGTPKRRMPAIREKDRSPVCLRCGEPFDLIKMARSNQEYCDPCRTLERQASGRKSAQVQAEARRSKNEIAFAELCQSHFESVECNAAIFVSQQGDKWDADVIIHDHKIAVLWNGAWHSRKITKKHSVAQVQNRDRIKMSVIKANGYVPYVIEDEGKSSKEKDRLALVEAEWQKFLVFVETLKPRAEMV